MWNWFPDGEWIAFSSDQHNPGGGSFELYLIHPNGIGLRKLVQSGSGGVGSATRGLARMGRTITTDYAGISAEPISYPHKFPYSEIFTMKMDGSDLVRLTHNAHEDGTPSWVPKFIRPIDVELPIDRPHCKFDDLEWLNKMPGYGLGGTADLVPNKAQCYAKLRVIFVQHHCINVMLILHCWMLIVRNNN
ncbi:LOW QUALITY PROTEIN: Tol-Pal system beta propeller repeat-containing protein [Parasponia andersonii]|uniref:Tol-Pal system beta propeller repeat-containing protein n=1 Tax=Parasponia andersonii TaxID=3476 RepID=A0A2P5BF02_PARAD|nr:LOW QUALITY PROTEIN: Tol-Pal system beta propeller repeat-containing protein [Parasponia andersonii]